MNNAESFDQMAWKAIAKIPRGKITTYKQIALSLGNPLAMRAVGNACNRNPNAPKVPCHRVVASGGGLGGYGFGIERKIFLLGKEGVKVKDGMIVDFEKKLFTFP